MPSARKQAVGFIRERHGCSERRACRVLSANRCTVRRPKPDDKDRALRLRMRVSPMESESFQWRDLEAGGLTSLGEACKELNDKLSMTHGFMTEATGSFAPAIILMSDGEPTDNYKHSLDKLKENNWFKAAIKVAIAIGDDANQSVLSEFTGNSEAVLTVHNKEQLKKIIRFVSVTASQVASSHASVGKDAPETKQEEMVEKIADTISNDNDLQGVDLGTDVTPGADSWGAW